MGAASQTAADSTGPCAALSLPGPSAPTDRGSRAPHRCSRPLSYRRRRPRVPRRRTHHRRECRRGRAALQLEAGGPGQLSWNWRTRLPPDHQPKEHRYASAAGKAVPPGRRNNAGQQPPRGLTTNRREAYRGGRLRHQDGGAIARARIETDPLAADHHAPCGTLSGAAIGPARSTRRRRPRRPAAAPSACSRRDPRAAARTGLDGIRCGHGWARCGGTSSAPSSRRAGSVNGPVRPATRRRPRSSGRPSSSASGAFRGPITPPTTASAVVWVRTFHQRSPPRPIAVLAMLDDHALDARVDVVTHPRLRPASSRVAGISGNGGTASASSRRSRLRRLR